MAVTRLKRKGKRNKSIAKNRINTIKQLNAQPTIKNVDIEEMKSGFEKAPAKATKSKKKEEAVVEAPATEGQNAAEASAE